MGDVEGGPAVALCVDFGSTFTKALLVDLATGDLLGTAEHPTTIDTDVLDGYDACRAALLRLDARAEHAEVLACSSAGGGLRIAVLGNELLVTAEAGRRVALSSGGRVVAVLAAASGLDPRGLGERLHEARADVVLLTGGTDGGNSEVLLAAAEALAGCGWHGPVVVAGNVDAREEVARRLAALPHVLADNVVPRIGELAPASARAAVREMFLAHVIGGKHLSARRDFTAMVRGATPDLVLTGVELLARGVDERHPGVGDVVVVDIGGATTDVHSVVEPDHEAALLDADGLAREVVASTPVTRTVEGDLGMRWSALSTVAEAGLDDADLVEAARARAERPGLLPLTDDEWAADEAIARAAATLALRRHAGRAKVVVGPDGRVVERTGKDLREVRLVVGSGGVLRNGRAGVADRVFGGSVGPDPEGGWQLPRQARVSVDRDYVLAAAGLLSADHPVAAYRLVRRVVDGGVPPGQ
ncbi:glutamate mutase L [Nocardioides ferulae]|uniref:glutamate mutase L n=1 Tax=Nocardioides ferulae TaxID=2340821 RepID=UPI000EB2E764|nr:glutamate mutase L [Nocardioides ferulae]